MIGIHTQELHSSIQSLISWSRPRSLSRQLLHNKTQMTVNNFCRRFGHQTAIVDDRLYIDGGLVNWNPMSTYPGNYTNTWLLWQDLTDDSDDGMPQIYANLSKNSSIPDVNGGYLWADETNKYIYLFGGEYFQTPPPSSFLLYAYDIINNFWISLGPPQQASISPVSYGAGTSVSERGEGYYYGGWLSNNSVSGWSGASRATTGLIKYDMDTKAWSNNTGPDAVRRAEGSMVFIPAGDGGMLVYLGGITDLYGNDTISGQGLDTVFLYDVLSSKWYTQTASGTIPGDRRRFCAGATWAPDYSSYNIYIYGGASMPPNTSGYDDLYVLSLPSFEWIKLYPTDGNYTGQYPHHSLTCNVVSGAQMLIIGGSFPLTEDCDVPQQWGTHNADLTAAFDDSPALWKLFATNETTYQVPDAIVSVVGGSPTGKATKTAPAHGWNSPDLPVLMTRTATIASRTATRAVNNANDSSGTKLSVGAIAGIAVGGAACLFLFAFGCWACVRRYHRRRLGIVDVGGTGGRRGTGLSPGGHPQLGFGDQQHMYEGGRPGQMIMYPSHHGYSDAPSPPGGTGSPHNNNWSPHGSPYSASSPYHRGGGGYVAAPQHSPPPAELAASNGSGYVHLTPVGSHLDSGSNTGTGTGTGTGSSGTYEMVPGVGGHLKSLSGHSSQVQVDTSGGGGGGGGEGVWTPQVSDIQMPPARRVGRQRGRGSEGSLPRTRPQELSAATDNERPGPAVQQQHTTYYHP
ncbi:cell wall anchored protein [Ophiostoma piceae UAMH 11346]|uniref:Cell wall anchored protein n=1 Tax=Ophiostoma piceae (strain UAMH 11346) TaxID=1262450 RepID=S3BZL9_OPHP1|nr:cell wall anchored protein [Ophiostoma piceae UAMH 11346]